MAGRLSLRSLWLARWIASGVLLVAADSALNGSLGTLPSELQTWLEGLIVPLPVGKRGELPMGLGNLTLTGGHCWNLQVGHVESKDMSNGTTLHFDVKLMDVEVKCNIEGFKEGDLQINLTMGRSSVDVAVRLDPYTSSSAPDYPVPLGGMNMTNCVADLVVTDIEFAGTSPLAGVAGGFPRELLLGVIGDFVNEPLCDGLRDVVNDKGTAAAQQGALMVGALLMDPFPLGARAEPLEPRLDWDRYPPMIVLEAMLKERFHFWADRVVQILGLTQFESTLVQSENISVKMRNFEIDGVGPKTRPGLTVDAQDQNIGVFADLHGLALRTTLALEVTVPGQPVLIENVNITIGLNNLSMELRAWVNERAVANLEIDEVMQSPKCLYQCTAGTVEPQSDALAVERMHIAMRPLLELYAPGSLETCITSLVNHVIAALYAGYLPTLNRLVNGALAMARNPLNSLLWKRINALPECSQATMFMGVDEKVIRSMWSLALAIFAFGLVAATAAQLRSRRRSFRGDTSAAAASGAAPAQGTLEGSEEGSEEDCLCLAAQPCVPVALKVLYPFAIVAVVFLFLYSDLAVGATVSVLTRAEGESATIGPMFTFSLLSTVVASWRSGAYFISLLTLLTSAVWPFVKLSFLMLAWLAPPSRFGTRTRGRVLNFLDTWGKYSFVDSWFLVLSMSAFALEWQSVGNASMKVQTTPTAAFYAFFCATSISLVLGHVASEFHMKAQALALAKGAGSVSPQGESAAAAALAPDEEEPDISSSTSSFSSVSRSLSEEALAKTPLWRFMASKFGRVGVLSVIVFSAVFAVVGSFMLSFDFEVTGIAIDFVFGRSVNKEYSLVNIGTSVADDRYFDVGLLGLEIVFLLLAVIVPLVELALMAALWVVPLRLAGQKQLLHACYRLDSWASLDVAVLVLVIACFEFGRMAEFLVLRSGFAGACSMIKDLTNDECLEVNMHARGTMVILCMAGVMLLVAPKVILHLCARLICKRSEGLPAAGVGGKALREEEEAKNNLDDDFVGEGDDEALEI